MGFLQSFLIALDMLRLHKMRAFLTMLGVIIGVMSVTIIVMMSNGMKAYISDQFAKIGSDTIYLMYDRSKLRRGEAAGQFDSLNLDTKKLVDDRCPSIVLSSGYREAGAHLLRFADRSVEGTKVQAIDENFITLNRVGLVEGRYFNKSDIDEMRNVCVIGEECRDRLFPDKNCLGKFVQLPGITLEVVGVSEKVEMFGQSESKSLFLPLTTANQKWLGGDRVDLILLRSKKGMKIDAAMEEVWQVLMAKTGNKPIYRIDSSENVMKVFQGIIGALGGVLAAIAALSLLVGGIGIMNIMLVSVTERTREIGLRKAVGAKKPVILLQFLIEAATLSLTGGLIGMGIAWFLGQIVTVLTARAGFPNENGIPTVFPLPAAMAALLFSAVIGMVFGFYPAMNAARLDPIVALRHE